MRVRVAAMKVRSARAAAASCHLRLFRSTAKLGDHQPGRRGGTPVSPCEPWHWSRHAWSPRAGSENGRILPAIPAGAIAGVACKVVSTRRSNPMPG